MPVTLADLSASLAQLAAEASRRLFHVPSPLGGRSALSFDGSRLLVPAAAVDRDETVEVLGPGGARLSTKARGFDPRLGFAVLELDQPLPETAWKPGASMPALGSLALSLAFPSPEGPESALGGIRIARGAPEAEDSYLQVDGPVFPGFAGGVLVGPEGELLGVIAAEGGGNRSWVLPALRARALVETLASRGFPPRAWLGLATLPLDVPTSLRKAAGGAEALLVTELSEEGAAARAGLLPGDILLSLAGRRLESPESLRALLDEHRPGEELSLDLLRGGSPLELRLKLGEAPVNQGGGGHRAPWGAFRRHHRGG